MPPEHAIPVLGLLIGALAVAGLGLLCLGGALVLRSRVRPSVWPVLVLALAGAVLVAGGSGMITRAAQLAELDRATDVVYRVHRLAVHGAVTRQLLDALERLEASEWRACGLPLERFLPAYRAYASERERLVAAVRALAARTGAEPSSLERTEVGDIVFELDAAGCAVTRGRYPPESAREQLRAVLFEERQAASAVGEQFEGIDFPMSPRERWSLHDYGLLVEAASAVAVAAFVALAAAVVARLRVGARRGADAGLVLAVLLLAGASGWLAYRAVFAPVPRLLSEIHDKTHRVYGQLVSLHRIQRGGAP